MRVWGRITQIAVAAASAAWALSLPAGAAEVAVTPSRDTTLFSSGDFSCGFGPLFAGETGSYGHRRALLAFDVAHSVPPGSTITSVELSFTITMSGQEASATDDFHVHRLLADWGEGVTSCGGGDGATAQPGDATWADRFFDTDPWSTPGGDFDASASATMPLPVSGTAIWPSTPALVADVQSWLDQPADNFGWILVGDETLPKTARLIRSRDDIPPPSLVIDYVAAPETPPAVPDGQTGSPLLVSKTAPGGADLVISWDTSLCAGAAGHHLIFGGGTGLPTTLGGTYGLSGGVCGLGSSSPFTWTGSPDPAVLDPVRRLLFLLVVADDGGTVEGSWGRASLSLERNGSGANGSGGECGILDKSLSNACGNPF
jgi:hypothetical protein